MEIIQCSKNNNNILNRIKAHLYSSSHISVIVCVVVIRFLEYLLLPTSSFFHQIFGTCTNTNIPSCILRQQPRPFYMNRHISHNLILNTFARGFIKHSLQRFHFYRDRCSSCFIFNSVNLTSSALHIICSCHVFFSGTSLTAVSVRCTAVRVKTRFIGLKLFSQNIIIYLNEFIRTIMYHNIIIVSTTQNF